MLERAVEALKTVIDPDVGVNIVDLGLVERLEVEPSGAEVDLIMTSPACPQGDYLADESVRALQEAFGADYPVNVDVLPFPLWDPDRMSEDAKRHLGWQP